MGSNGRFDTQDNNNDAWVGVSSDGYHHDTDAPIASEFLIKGKTDGTNIHLGLDEYGNEVFRAER